MSKNVFKLKDAAMYITCNVYITILMLNQINNCIGCTIDLIVWCIWFIITTTWDLFN